MVRQLGQGGMGQVWEAHDTTNLRRSVAIKMITSLAGGEGEADEARARFLREARITSHLQHPNIVTVHDLVEVDDGSSKVLLLVMELLRGEGLDAVLRRGPVPLARAAEWGAQVCDALAEAHRSGVLHRDIKPSNIQILPSGATKILDFGIARAADPAATGDRLTQTGFIVGTLPYMSPEQLNGRPEARSDLYALGCVLFEMITGRLPFQAPDTVGYITAHVSQRPPAPSSIRPGIPPAWDELVLTLLSKEPRRRYSSAVDTARVLRGLGSDVWHPPTILDARTPEPEPTGRAEAVRGVAAQATVSAARAEEETPPSGEVPRNEPNWEWARKPQPPGPTGPPLMAVQPAGFPRPLSRHAYGLLTKLLVSAAIIAMWATSYHLTHKNDSLALTGPTMVVFVLVILGCVGAQAIRLATDRRKPRSRISLDTDRLTVEQEVDQGGRTVVTSFSIKRSSIERIGIQGLGREACVVVRFTAADAPSPEWLRHNGITHRPLRGGYVLRRPARVAFALWSANAMLRRLRIEFADYAQGHVAGGDRDRR